MVRASHILGMNARVQQYTSLNPAAAKKFGFSKLRAKRFLAKHGIPVPQLYAEIDSKEDLREFEWKHISGSFAVKPSNGLAGSGIIVIAERHGEEWIDVNGKEFSEDDLDLHASDILDGQYSTWGSSPQVVIEERIPIHPDLAPYCQLGTPDIRVIVYRKIPVMAMVRLPTEASKGRANMHQGALALGIDFGTGKTTKGVSGSIAYSTFGNRKLLSYFPGTNTPVSGIEIPFWNDVLKTAVRVANATGLIYLGCDIFLHPEKGPMVAEVNAFPGLSIQLANDAGLRKRLERIEGVQARNVSHAVKIGQTLFAENYPSLASGDIDRPILNTKEQVIVYGDDGKKEEIDCLVNTGRYRSIIAEKVATHLELNEAHDLLWKQKEEDEGKIPVVEAKIKIRDRFVTTSFLVSKRLNSKKHDIELGRKDLAGFLVAGEET